MAHLVLCGAFRRALVCWGCLVWVWRDYCLWRAWVRLTGRLWVMVGSLVQSEVCSYMVVVLVVVLVVVHERNVRY